MILYVFCVFFFLICFDMILYVFYMLLYDYMTVYDYRLFQKDVIFLSSWDVRITRGQLAKISNTPSRVHMCLLFACACI